MMGADIGRAIAGTARKLFATTTGKGSDDSGLERRRIDSSELAIENKLVKTWWSAFIVAINTHFTAHRSNLLHLTPDINTSNIFDAFTIYVLNKKTIKPEFRLHLFSIIFSDLLALFMNIYPNLTNKSNQIR